MKTLFVIIGLLLCLLASAQIDTTSVIATYYELGDVNDTIPGTMLITKCEECPAYEMFGYKIREGYVFGADEWYLDRYFDRIPVGYIVWMFVPANKVHNFRRER